MNFLTTVDPFEMRRMMPIIGLDLQTFASAHSGNVVMGLSVLFRRVALTRRDSPVSLRPLPPSPACAPRPLERLPACDDSAPRASRGIIIIDSV